MRIPTGIYRGIVVDDQDPDRVGRVKVHIPALYSDVVGKNQEFGSTQSVATLYPGAMWCRVSTPIGGTHTTSTGGQSSYGLNGFRPRRDNEVLVAFSPESMAGVVIGVLPDITKTNRSAFGPIVGKSADGTVGLIQENNRQSQFNDLPPIHPIQKVIDGQGLGKDRIRGLNYSSLGRDPSPRVMGLASPDGSSIVIDDGELDNQSDSGIRIRTAGGSQILLDDVSGLIYLINKNGTAWIEMNRNGDIDVFSQTLNFTTLGDMNFTCGGEFNVHASRGVNVRSDGEDGIKMDATIGGIDIHSASNMNLQSDRNTNVRAAGNYRETAARIDMNGPAAQQTQRSKIYKHPSNRIYKEKITRRIPEREPWSGHLDVSVLDTASASGAASISESKSYYYGQPSNPSGHNDQTGNFDLMNYPEAPAAPGQLITYASGVDRRIHPELALKLNQIAQKFGRPLHIISAHRSPTHNAKVGGARRSQHMLGNAVDITAGGLSTSERLRLIMIASSSGIKGIGVYNNSLHFDIRPAAATFWGPDFSSGSTPAYAVTTLQQHSAGRFVA